ncbi:hypothetical protein AALA00_06155 [Lachnospiraceae bacterium 46-15]
MKQIIALTLLSLVVFCGCEKKDIPQHENIMADTNGNGFGIGKGRTVFEYNAGNVALWGNQGRRNCVLQMG